MTIIEQLAEEPLPVGWYRRSIKNLALRRKLGDERVTEDLASEGSSHEGMIALIVSGDITGTKEVPVNKYVTLETLKEKARQVVQKNAQKKKKGRQQDIELVFPHEGTVLLTVARKKAGIVGMLNVERAVFNHAVYAMTPNPAELYPDWLFYYFKNPRIRRIIQKDFMLGKATYADVTLIQKLEVPIPPKPQQEQLLRRIQALLPDVERAQILLKQNQTAIELLLDSTLQEVFTPTRRRAWDHQPLKELITIDDVPLFPLQSSENFYYHPLVASDINPVIARATIDLTRSENALSGIAFSPPTNNQNVILYAKNYNKDNVHLRVAMPYKDSRQDQRANIDGFKYGSGLYQLTVSDKHKRILPRFLFWSLLSPQLTKDIKGDTPPKGKLTIQPDKIYSSELFFPKIDEQEHISAYLDSIQEKVSRMYVSQIVSMQAIENMEESILNQAFAGEL